MQSQRMAFVASPQAREPCYGRGGRPRGERTQRPTAGVAAARPQADPAVGGGACPKGALEPAPWRGATQPGRRGPSSGARGRDAFPFPLAVCRDAGTPETLPAMATARPIPRLIERKQPKGGHGGAGTRAGSRYASERWTRGQGSARFRCLMAARATAEMGRAACLKPPPGLSLSKSPFFCA